MGIASQPLLVQMVSLIDSSCRLHELPSNSISVSLQTVSIHLFRLVWLQIDCETVTEGEKDTLEPWKFKVSYDKLVFGCGAEASTFGIRGVTEHATFLREVHHAQEIRRKLLLNLMLSDIPGMGAAQYVVLLS